MTDAPFDVIDPIEARLAARVRGWADQAVEPVDAIAIARAAASAPVLSGPPAWRFHSMTSPFRIALVAAAIGVLAQSASTSCRAAPTSTAPAPSASPAPDDARC